MVESRDHDSRNVAYLLQRSPNPAFWQLGKVATIERARFSIFLFPVIVPGLLTVGLHFVQFGFFPGFGAGVENAGEQGLAGLQSALVLLAPFACEFSGDGSLTMTRMELKDPITFEPVFFQSSIVWRVVFRI